MISITSDENIHELDILHVNNDNHNDNYDDETDPVIKSPLTPSHPIHKGLSNC